ncbi:MAG: SxtJ family membrane protein [Phycisphaeraceae bacterium]
MLDINKDPSRNELRWFGLIFAMFFGILGLMIWWQFSALHVAKVLWIIGPAVAVIYYVVPPTQKAIYLAWVYLTYPIGFCVSHILMGIIYYLVLTPTGLLLRLFGKDPMTRQLDRDAASYWIERKPITGTSRYFKQY